MVDANIHKYMREHHKTDATMWDALVWFTNKVRASRLTCDGSMKDKSKEGVFIVLSAFVPSDNCLFALGSSRAYFVNISIFRDAFPDLRYEAPYVRLVEE